MIALILGQVRFLLLSVCLGMALLFGYELLHMLRWIFVHRKWVIWVEDIFYWCLVAVPAFIVLFIYNDGVIRWYGMLATLGGGILYEKGLGRPIRLALAKMLYKPRRRWERWKQKKSESRQQQKVQKEQRKEKERKQREIERAKS